MIFVMPLFSDSSFYTASNQSTPPFETGFYSSNEQYRQTGEEDKNIGAAVVQQVIEDLPEIFLLPFFFLMIFIKHFSFFF